MKAIRTLVLTITLAGSGALQADQIVAEVPDNTGGAVAGNAIANNNTSAQEVGGVFRITIQLDQGGQRVIDVSDLGDLRQGDRVQVTNGQQISRLN